MFNFHEQIKQLLALLAELLEYSSSWKIKTLSELGREVLVYSVHSGMLVRHYERPQFYLSLDLCAAECHSSRELLIAIGWLLAEENLLRRLYLQENVGVRSFPDVCQKVSVREQLSGSNQEMEWTQRLEEHLNRLLWNMGRCRMATKQLFWKQREIAKLTHKIHTSTQGKSLDKTGICLSPADVYILRYGDELRKVNMAVIIGWAEGGRSNEKYHDMVLGENECLKQPVFARSTIQDDVVAGFHSLFESLTNLYSLTLLGH